MFSFSSFGKMLGKIRPFNSIEFATKYSTNSNFEVLNLPIFFKKVKFNFFRQSKPWWCMKCFHAPRSWVESLCTAPDVITYICLEHWVSILQWDSVSCSKPQTTCNALSMYHYLCVAYKVRRCCNHVVVCVVFPGDPARAFGDPTPTSGQGCVEHPSILILK